MEYTYLFDEGTLVELARQATGHDDFGDESFREPLRVLLDSLAHEARLTPAGVQAEHQRLLKSLTDRLQIQAAVKHHPEILDERIIKPLVIVGMMRTGSTKLQRVIATDRRWRHLPLWESIFPVPLLGETKGDPSPRIAATRAMLAGIDSSNPQILAGHPMFAEAPEEESMCSQLVFGYTHWIGLARVPTYLRWALGRSMVDSFRTFRLMLQYLQWQEGGKPRRWLLKSPFHLGFLDDFCALFPDATLVWTHRQPLLDVCASGSQLNRLCHEINSIPADPLEVGQRYVDHWGQLTQRQLAQRERADGDWILDVSFRDIIKDCSRVVAKIYERAGMAYTAEIGSNIAGWEANNPQHAHGKFLYRAEEFGLTEEQVAHAFGTYYRWLEETQHG